MNQTTSAMVPQRRVRSLDFEPGHWKKQLPGKIRSIAAKGDVAELRALLREHPEYLDHGGSHNRTLLWEATRAGRMAAVKFLVQQGADLYTTGCYNSESHVQITPYVAACYYRRDDIVAYLKANGGNRLDIFRAAFLGERGRVSRRLAAHPELLNAEDPHDNIYYMPLLSFAVAGGHVALVLDLLQRGALVSSYSAQLIYLAARMPRMDVLELLVAHGADPRAADVEIFVAVDDLAVLHYLLQHGTSVNRPGQNGAPPLVYVSRGDKGEHVAKARFLIEQGADVNAAGPDGRTALHYAAAAGHTALMALLLEQGADPQRTDDKGETPLSLARAAKKQAAVDLLSR
jgi:ankyrin repeat protein